MHRYGLHGPSLSSLLVFLFSCARQQQHPIGFAQGTDPERLKRFRIHAREQQRNADQWLEAHYHNGKDYWEPCPCAKAKHCSPISSNKTKITVKKKEAYGFAGPNDTGEHYNWTYISTVALAVQDKLMCRAHQHASRAVLGTPSFNLTYIAGFNNPDERTSYISVWVQRALFMVTARHRDGMVFDYEEPLEENSPEIQAYVDLINATRQAFHAEALQLSTCVAWAPNGIDGRYYPYQQLADVSDLLYVMDYDTQSQITQGPCMANANAPLAGTKQGIQQYVRLGIDPNKLILGVPW
jgi:Di-N-acetylchitobiase